MLMRSLKDIKHNKKLRVGIVLSIVSVVSIATFLLLWSPVSIEDYYSERLKQLHGLLQQLPTSFELSGNTDADLKEYGKNLNTGLDLCSQMSSRGRRLQMQKPTVELQQSVESINRLCTDLNDIFKYQRALYSSLDVYLTMEVMFPSPDSPQFSHQLSQVQSVIKNTLAVTRKINNEKVADPALGELITQIEEAEKLANAARDALGQGDSQRAQASAEQLRSSIYQDKADLLLARNYFWNNTVQLEQLLRAIEKLKAEFES
jgi:hypothetical protein